VQLTIKRLVPESNIINKISFVAKIFGLMTLLLVGAVKKNDSMKSPVLHRLIFHFEEEINDKTFFKANVDGINEDKTEISKNILKNRLPFKESLN